MVKYRERCHFHRNQDFGDVNNKLEKVMHILDDQILGFVPKFTFNESHKHSYMALHSRIFELYAYTLLKKKNNRPHLPTSILYSLAQQRKTRWSIFSAQHNAVAPMRRRREYVTTRLVFINLTLYMLLKYDKAMFAM